MKFSNKPKHYAARGKGCPNKNQRGHRSDGGLKSNRSMPTAMEIVRMIFGKLGRRARRVFFEQQRAINKT